MAVIIRNNNPPITVPKMKNWCMVNQLNSILFIVKSILYVILLSLLII